MASLLTRCHGDACLCCVVATAAGLLSPIKVVAEDGDPVTNQSSIRLMFEIMLTANKNIFVLKTLSAQVSRNVTFIMTTSWTTYDSKPLTTTELGLDHHIRARVIPSTTIFRLDRPVEGPATGIS